MAKEYQDKEKDDFKKSEIEAKEMKILALAEIKEEQEKRRKDQIKKNQDEFRKAIEERKAQENQQIYLSPNTANKS